MNPWVYRRPSDVQQRVRATWFRQYGSVATFICMKSVTGAVMYATATIVEIKATATGVVPYASGTAECE